MNRLVPQLGVFVNGRRGMKKEILRAAHPCTHFSGECPSGCIPSKNVVSALMFNSFFTFYVEPKYGNQNLNFEKCFKKD